MLAAVAWAHLSSMVSVCPGLGMGQLIGLCNCLRITMDVSMVLKEALVDLSRVFPWAAARSLLTTMLHRTWLRQVPDGAFLLSSLQRQDG